MGLPSAALGCVSWVGQQCDSLVMSPMLDAVINAHARALPPRCTVLERGGRNIAHRYPLSGEATPLIPGPGHMEMKIVKSYVALIWDIFWKSLVQLLNFKSENALKAAKSFRLS